MDEGYPYFGLIPSGWRVRIFYYPKMCTYSWRVWFGYWRDSLSPQKGRFTKDWHVFVRLGRAAWTFQVVKRVV